MRTRTILAALTIIAIYTSAYADRRNYVWTYQYITMPKGVTEMEFYQTTKFRDTDLWEYWVEIEQGLTERWDFSVYQIFKQSERGALSWDAVKFRTRYRFGEEGMYLLDPLLYLEYKRKIDSQKQNKFEGKLILAKTVSRFNLAINPVYEFYFAPDSKHEVGLDVGMSWEFHPAFILGVESTSRIEFEETTSVGSYLGPTLSFASGQWWYSIGAVLGLTADSDVARVRFLMGVAL